MAVTRKGQVIVLGAAADAVVGKIKVQSITLDHTAAAAASLTDSADVVIAALRTTSSKLTEQLIFPCPIIVDGIKAGALSAGTLTVHIV